MNTLSRPNLKSHLLALAAAIALAACGGDDSPAAATPATPLPDTAFQLQVLHVADMDSGGDLVTNSKGLSALLDKFRTEMPANTVFLSSGDNYIPGPFFNAADDASLSAELGKPSAGRGDLGILNAMGLQASVFGNHEFDNGTNTVASLIKVDGAWQGTQFPYLSANLDFSGDSNLASLASASNDGADAATLKNKIAKYAVITVAGQKIGVVGASTPTLPDITTMGGVTVLPTGADKADIDKLAAQIQPAVDALTAAGVNKIILLAHMQQLNVEKGLAPKLRDVDLIIGGGSNTGLYDSTDYIRPGDTNGGNYPLSYTSAKGEPTLLVNLDADYKYLGRIILDFDAQGRIIPGKLDTAKNGAWASDTTGLTRASLSAADAIPAVAAIADKIGAVIASKDGNLFGATSVYLEGDRVTVRNQESNLGNLSADANLAWGRSVDASTTISIKNGGGIRSSIGYIDAPPGSTTGGSKVAPPANPAAGKLAGDISQLDIEFALKFNNGLSLLTLSAEQLKQVLEHGVSDWAPGSTQGKFPQVAGVRFSFDPGQAAGSRIRTLVVDDPDGNGPLTGPQVVYSGGAFKVALSTSYRIVTLDFLAGGGDAYPFKTISDANPGIVNRVDLLAAGTNSFTTAGGEQNAFAQFMQSNHPRSTPYAQADSTADLDARIQNLSLRSDSLPQ